MKKITDIYPLTIVSMRYGGFAIINADCDCDACITLQCAELYTDVYEYMNVTYPFLDYGIGNSLETAFEHFLQIQNANDLKLIS
jgi:hypothetical protein